jgi:hypothetical protein
LELQKWGVWNGEAATLRPTPAAAAAVAAVAALRRPQQAAAAAVELRR